MHLLPVQSRSLDEEAAAVDLELSPAPMMFASFTDTDLAVMATAWDQQRSELPGLRLVSLAKLKHPYSVDLFIERLVAKTRFVLFRLLGGADYWRYGVDELAAAARRHGIHLAILPGDDRHDPRLEEASTVARGHLVTLADYFHAGGIDNAGQALRLGASLFGRDLGREPPCPVPAAGLFSAGCRDSAADAPHALLVFYRSALLAGDVAPMAALADVLAARGARVSAHFVTSLKDPASIAVLGAWLGTERPDVIVTTTAFSAADRNGTVLDRADAPVLQAILAGSERASWQAHPRGLGSADLAMNIVLPEVDGRIGAGVLSFKAEAARHPDLEFVRTVHQPDPDGVGHVADLAIAWAALRKVPRHERRLACVLSDYPGKKGRAGYAVGLDTPQSIVAIAEHLRHAGFSIGTLPMAANLMCALTSGPPQPTLPLDAYRQLFAALPAAFREAVTTAWGDASDDPDLANGAFQRRFLRAGRLVVAVQPDRGSAADRRSEYHDPALPPRHGYIAFYLWLRRQERIDALIHLGTHGTLEWLPGKAVALGPECAPAVITGALPVIYPFIVNNPGEAAQAKRRIGAVTIGHLTPPLVDAGTHGDTADLEQLFDEYAEAATLDPRRARLLSRAILDLAETHGLLPKAADRSNPEAALTALDAWLCDLKEMRIGDGLHVFGSGGDGHGFGLDPEARGLLVASGPAELDNLVRALDGRFVPPGPAGVPGPRRLDVLPTGRNLYSVDTRSIPTRTAWEIGIRLAEDLVTRYAQDHGDWPRCILLDLWGSATMRTGGDDFAQGLALMGVRPRWDHGSTRVGGFEILPLAKLGRARVDVTLRISGLFRDAFPEQIALFDAAVRAVSALDESVEDNPLVEVRRARGDLVRVFGAAPGTYGVGLARRLAEDPGLTQTALGEAYLDATSHGFARNGHPIEAGDAFRGTVARADAFASTGDLPGTDILDSDTFAEHAGGFAAAAALLGNGPALYRADTSGSKGPKLRAMKDEITRALRARATNPRWIAGQMRHGHRGAIALGETLDALYAFAATTDLVPSEHFDLFFGATLGNSAVRSFLERENPAVARSMAEKFEAALASGRWTSRRNSTRLTLDEVAEAVP